MKFLSGLNKEGDVYVLGEKQSPEFENLYIELRQIEGRILTDEQVKSLPFLADNKHTKEWKVRKESSNRFLKALADKEKLTILEIGCGNGWFSNQMASVNENQVVGQDINMDELGQASKCFKRDNLHFISCFDFDLLPPNQFDLIVFNASIQYFQYPNELFELLQTKLSSNGGIHIIDSPLYKDNNQALAARERSLTYYTGKGFSALASYYYHHQLNELNIEKVHYKPTKLGKLFGNQNPFHWIQIKTS